MDVKYKVGGARRIHLERSEPSTSFLSSSKLIMTVCRKFLVLASTLWLSSGCKSPSAAVGFDISRFFGVWYEVGKYTTLGWKYSEYNCACTQTEIKSGGGSGAEATSTYTCREGSPSGSVKSRTGVLKRAGSPGKWRESFTTKTGSIESTIVYMDDNFALAYDCKTFLGFTNYCLHVLSRTPTIDDEMLDLLLKVVDELGLNNHTKKFRKTKQSGCPL